MDIDDTLLDFSKSEQAAYKQTLEQFNINYFDKLLEDYTVINRKCWQQMEAGELSKPQVLINRHKETFNKHNIVLDYEKFNSVYINNLGKYSFLLDDAMDVMQSLYLSGQYYIIALSNGVESVQLSRLASSCLDRYFHKIFISETIGFSKPDERLYKYVFSCLPQFNINEALAVGDSLTGDIKGGKNFGIDTCWLNPNGKPCGEIVPTYTITKIKQLLTILL